MSYFSPLTPYMVWIKVGAILAFGLGCYVYGGSNARARCERAALAKENKALTQAIADNAKANDERRAAQKEVDRLATLPPKVVTVVRRYPSNCTLPRPVTDSVREQVRETNSAIKAAVR